MTGQDWTLTLFTLTLVYRLFTLTLPDVSNLCCPPPLHIPLPNLHEDVICFDFTPPLGLVS